MMSVFFKRDHFPIFLILTAGFLVRLIGINFGLPDLYHADEPIVVNHAVAYGMGDLNPHFFKIPPLVSYLLFVCYGISYLFGHVLGIFSGLEDFQALFLSDPTSFYLIGRVIFGTLCGVVTVYVFYKLVERFVSRIHAVFASFFFAFAFIHVRDSHYIYVDIPLLLILVGAYFPIFGILEDGLRKNYIWFGILLGAAGTIKYNGALILVPFLLAHLMRKGREWYRFFDVNLLWAAIFSLVSFIVLNPFSMFDFRFFLREIAAQSGAEGVTGFIHFTRSLPEGIGWPLIVSALLGAFLNLNRRKVLFLVFIITYCCFLVFFSQPFERYVLPLIPFVVLFSADCVVFVIQRLKWSRIFYGPIIFLMIVPSLFKIYISDLIFVKKDVRSLAKEWIETSLPSGAKIAMAHPFFAPPLKSTIIQLEEKKFILSGNVQKEIQNRRLELMINQAKRDHGKRFELYFLKEAEEQKADSFLFAQPAVSYDLSELAKRGISYVLVAKTGKKKDIEFYEKLKTYGKLVARFSPFRDSAREEPIDRIALTGGPLLWSDLKSRSRNGQIIEVYQI